MLTYDVVSFEQPGHFVWCSGADFEWNFGHSFTERSLRGFFREGGL